MTYDELMAQLSGFFTGNSGGAQSFAAPSAGQWTPQLNANGSVGGSLPGANVGGSNSGLGLNLGTGQLALSGLGALGNLWGAGKANSLAKDQFNFAKSTTNTNLNNQIKSYNTALEDRLTSRGVAQGQDPAAVQAAIDKNRLTR